MTLYQSNYPFDIFRVHLKSREKYINSIAQTGLSGVYFQLNQYENYGACQENQQIGQSNQASSSTTNSFLQVVRKSNGKNDIHDSSNWGSALTHQILAEGSCSQLTTTSPEVGSTIHTLDQQQSRITMVDELCHRQEWAANTKDRPPKTSNYNPRRCFRYRLGSRITRTRNNGILDRGGESSIYQRQGIIGNLFRTSTPCTKVQKQHDKNLYRQYYRIKIRNQIRRYVFTTTTTIGSRHTRLMQQLQSQGRISTYSWSRQRTSRSTESNNDPKSTIRNQTAEENFQPDQPDVGTPENRRLCITYESPTTSVLEPETGPSSDRSRCLQSTMDNKGNVSFPAMEIHTSSNTTTEETEDTISSTDNTVVDNTTLVSDGNEDETASRTNDIQASTMDNGRMEVIRKKRKNEGLNDDEIEFLAHTIRQNTNRVYNNGWRKWEDWCKQQQPPSDPQEYNVDHVFKFLMDNRKYSVQHLNGIRSAIASVFKVIHPTQPPLAQQEKIAQFFQAKRLQEIKIPKEADMITWDTDILTNFIKTTWADNTLLTLTDLQLKTLSLLCLATMARPRSDIGRLQFQNIHFKIEEGQAISVIIHFTEAKETNIKSTQLGLVEDRELCPTTTLYFFIQKTASIRSSLPKDHTLFLTYLDNKDKETSSVRPSTVSNWIKSIMNKAGIDITKYKAHSIRSASSTKAVEKSHSIQAVKQHANWSSNANTFERYYYKPTAQQSSSTSIANSIFSLTDNHTTLTDGAESKRIVVGTTNNTIVDEAKSRNVVHPPWYQAIFKKYFG